MKRFDMLLNATTRRASTGSITSVVGVGQAITELNKCYEDCMMVNGGQPPPGWPLLEICADAAVFLRLRTPEPVG